MKTQIDMTPADCMREPSHVKGMITNKGPAIHPTPPQTCGCESPASGRPTAPQCAHTATPAAASHFCATCEHVCAKKRHCRLQLWVQQCNDSVQTCLLGSNGFQD